jgi:UDP-N-acetylglucosamine 2-epimerase (non-hydrolysing)
MTMTLPEVHLIGGSCAEALRLAPVAIAMREQGRLTPFLLAAGPDPAAVDATFAAFGLTPQVTLPTGADPAEALRRFDSFWSGRTPAAVVVRDSLGGALAAHWRRIPIMQVDAGRRTGDLAPSASDADRRMLAQVATVHLAATPLTAMNLLDERIAAGDVLLTGSTVADAMRALADRRPPAATGTRRLVLIGAGRDKADAISPAVRMLAASFPDLEVRSVDGTLPCVDRSGLVAEAYLVVTGDEDLAEEALAAGVPVLVLGDVAGLAEALHAGSAMRVDNAPVAVAAKVAELMPGRVRRDGMAACGNPYGDGFAAHRVAQATAALLGHGPFPDPMPVRPVAGVAS